MDCETSETKRNLCKKDSIPFNNGYVCLRDTKNDSMRTDTLHLKGININGCTKNYCKAAFVNKRTTILEVKSKQAKIDESKEFLTLFYENKKLNNSKKLEERIKNVVTQIVQTNYYELTKEELLFGIRAVWRNSSRCIARPYYSSLELVDARHVTSAKEMFDEICKFYKECTGNGIIKLKSLIFPQRKGIFNDYRIWNSQLVNYACYKIDDNTFIGDKAQYELTQKCFELGWKGGQRTEYDILPLVLQANGKEPELFEFPKDLVVEVPLTHPVYDFEKLKMKWFVTVSVSVLAMDIGGCQFTAAPFTGFYTCPEIARAMIDPDRYNKMESIANIMNLDKESDVLWKERVFEAMNFSVMHSYYKAKCSIIDHHTMSDQFKKFFESETKLRGGCPSDWIWLVSQPATHIDDTYHMEMLNYKLRPSTEYQLSGWEAQEELKKLQDENRIYDFSRSFI